MSRASSDNDKDDLLSDNTSDTSFCEDPANVVSKPDNWQYTRFRTEGRVAICGEWTSRTKSHRYLVVGPDWPCVIMTYVAIIVPSVFVYLYLLENVVEKVIYFIILASTVFGLTAVFLADPGLVRKYHHARTRMWTFCDHCESFRPPGSVHCSTCQVCIAGYDHHCPVRNFVSLFNLGLFLVSLFVVDWKVCGCWQHHLL